MEKKQKMPGDAAFAFALVMRTSSRTRWVMKSFIQEVMDSKKPAIAMMNVTISKQITSGKSNEKGVKTVLITLGSVFLLGMTAGMWLHRVIIEIVVDNAPDSLCAYCQWHELKKRHKKE